MSPLSENSSVRIGLVIIGLSALFAASGVLGGGIWWGATLQTKVDMVLQKLELNASSQQSAQKEISDLEKRVIALEIQCKAKTP